MDEENAFTLTPMSQDIELTPGTSYTGYITVVSPASSKTDFNYKVSVSPFNVVGEDYAVDLATEYNRSMITKWITIPESTGTLKPNESRKVEFKIDVPADAPAGGQYAALTVSDNSEASGSEGLLVRNVLEMASIVYASVDGETVHKTEILENNIPSFVTSSPVTLSALIKNDGNVHEYAIYTVTVTDNFTGRVILPSEDSEGVYSEVIMPETTISSQREISNLPAIGVVKVSQTIRIGGETSVQEGTIIICPIWFIALVVLTISALITTIVMIVKKHRRNKKSLSAI